MKIYLKTAQEIEKMRVANQVVAAVLDACEAAVKPGVSTWELNEIADREMKRLGGRSAFLGYKPSGAPPFRCSTRKRISTSCSVNSRATRLM